MAIFERCCCCSLKSGVILLGILSLIFPVFLGAISLLVLLGAGLFYPDYDDLLDEYNQKCYSQDDDRACQNAQLLSSSIQCTTATFGALLAISSVYIMASSCLIHGARKSDERLLIPYMMLLVLSMILELVGFFLFYFVIYPNQEQDAIVMPAVITTIGTAFHILIFLFVFSLSQQIRSTRGPHIPGMRTSQKKRNVQLTTLQPVPSSSQPSLPSYPQSITYYQQPPPSYKLYPVYYQQPQLNFQQKPTMNHQPHATINRKPSQVYHTEKKF